eukprot:3437142-Amphidinium_carterae.1
MVPARRGLLRVLMYLLSTALGCFVADGDRGNLPVVEFIGGDMWYIRSAVARVAARRPSSQIAAFKIVQGKPRKPQ